MKIDKCYINIQGWMYLLGCKRFEEVAAYALIYGFSQDGESKFNGSFSYLQEFLMCSKPTAISIIKSLVEKGLVIKHQYTINRVVLNQYTAIVPQSLQGVKNFDRGSKENLQVGGKEFLPDINIDKNKNITDPPLSPQGEKTKEVIDLSFVEESFIPIMEQWIAYKKEKRQKYTPTGLKQCYKKLQDYSKGDTAVAQEIIEQAIANNWAGFFPLKQQANGNSSSNPRSSIQYGNPLYERIWQEMERNGAGGF